MAGLVAVRAALAAAIGNIDGIQVLTSVSGSVNPPAVVITPSPGTFLNYQEAMSPDPYNTGEALGYVMRLVLLASQADVASGTATLDQMLDVTGPLSVPAALFADPSLGGVVSYAVPVTAQRFGTLRYSEIDYLGCELYVDVKAP